METLTQRKKDILYSIVNTYLETMQPVGSRTVNNRYDMHISAATVRNEMCDLEEMGFITHPHTSAGRIPTDKGYRYYVDNLTENETLSEKTICLIKKECKKKLASIEDLMETVSRIVSTVSEQACISVLFQPQLFHFKQVSLVPLEGRRLLVIWVTTGGLVLDDIVHLKDDIEQSELVRIMNFLNSELQGKRLDEVDAVIEQKLAQMKHSLRSLYMHTSNIVKHSLSKRKHEGTVFFEGRNYLLGKPEFHNMEKTRKIFEILENRETLFQVLAKPQQSSNVRICIGHENDCDGLWDCTLISAGYGLEGMCIGSINILGPRRIYYDRLLGLMRYVSHMMTDVVRKREF